VTTKPFIRIEEGGIFIQFRAGVSQISWDAISKVMAFKRDAVFLDCICLVIQSVTGETVEVNEETAGWSDLVAALPEKLPGTPDFQDWFTRVAFPAFMTNFTVLYERRQPNARPDGE
jgi:hypothetical protein